MTIGDVQISEGKARVFGGLTFHLLYVSDGERRRICQLSGELPIDETIHLDGLTGGDKVCITWEVEDLNLHLINSRKLGVRAIVTLHAWIEELCDLAVPMEIRGESDVAVKGRNIAWLSLQCRKRCAACQKGAYDSVRQAGIARDSLAGSGSARSRSPL